MSVFGPSNVLRPASSVAESLECLVALVRLHQVQLLRLQLDLGAADFDHARIEGGIVVALPILHYLQRRLIAAADRLRFHDAHLMGRRTSGGSPSGRSFRRARVSAARDRW